MNALALRMYAALMWLVQPLLRLKLARRAKREPGYAEAIAERFGRYTQPFEARSELVWLHAVSLGETRTAAALLKALRAAHPGLRVLLTHGTATGRTEGVGLLAPGDVQVWQPWDSQAAVARFLDHFKPRVGLLMETEVWPCLVAAADARHLPLVLVNARLSDKSLHQALRMGPLALPAFAALKQIYAQSFEDAARFAQLGVTVAGVFGNLKFDAEPDAAQLAQGRAWHAEAALSVLMFASSREGEEDDFFKHFVAMAQSTRAQAAMKSIATAGPGQAIRALVVPRHPQRFDAVEALAQQHGLRVSRRSSWADGPGRCEQAQQADVWLGDSLGEMALYYGLADVALLGGSFEPLGGQNLIEAAACGCPVVMGPHTFNFLEAAQLAEAGGAALRVADMREGVQTALRLLGDAPALQRAADAGRAFAGQHRGATGRTLEALRAYL